MKAPRSIEVIGADANNLANVDVGIPRTALTAIVGVSGSGKSSLIEDTIAAEAAVRMRRFLDVDIGAAPQDVRAFIGALPPTILVGQRSFRASSRSTVATSSPLLRLLRRLFVRYGEPFADDVNEPVPPPSPETFATWLSRHAEGRAVIWAVPLQLEANTGVRAAQRLAEAGLTSAVVFSETDRGARIKSGTPVSLTKFRALSGDVRHTLEARVGEAHLGPKTIDKLRKFLDLAWRAADGRVFVELLDVDRSELKRAFTFGLDTRIHRVHPKSPRVFRVPSAHLFSFNAPEHDESGACSACKGSGRAAVLDEDALIPHPERSVHGGAFALWSAKNYKYVNIQHGTIEGLRGRSGFDPDKPWRDQPPSARALVLDGSSDLVEDRDPKTKKRLSLPYRYHGFRAAILQRVGVPTPTGKALQSYVKSGPCPSCGGTRWNDAARAIRVGALAIDACLGMPFSALRKEAARLKGDGLGDNIRRVAESFVKVGLGHLSGDRGMLEVSDGESRRSRLAGALNSRLAGLLLVLDEPGRGLHEADLASLGEAIVDATNLHTVVMSEHRQRLVSRADHIVEMGPGAGASGGTVTNDGPPKGTRWAKPLKVATDRRGPELERKWLKIEGVELHNVRGANVELPLGSLTCIAGVSGSGKSSFIRGALVPALTRLLPADRVDVEEFRTQPGTWRAVKGAAGIGALHALDQSPSSAQRRSLVATFLDVAEPLRCAFAATPEARALRLSSADFGTNSGRGRCQECLGLGKAKDGGPCSVCGGLRFGIDVLSVRLSGRNFAELLTTPLADLLDFQIAGLGEGLVLRLIELGLGHLALGRSLDTLSGGEIQRLRVARALARHQDHGALFVIDEPACGLHPGDVERLYGALRHIVANGANTVVIVEHDPYLLAHCDHIVEFGPVGGPAGGKVIAQGAPDQVARQRTPTGLALSSAEPQSPRSHRPFESVSRSASTMEVARRARAEIRQLVGDDVEVPDEGDVVQPASTFDHASTENRRAHELADLDHSVAAVVLDTLPSPEGGLASLRAKWEQNPRASLRIHPFLDSLAVWGPTIPRSTLDVVRGHLVAMGLRAEGEPLSARATGERLRPRTATDSARRSALRDAWAVGNGYVELVDEAGHLLAIATDRLLDLDRGLVGPRRPRTAHFSRRDPLGSCHACRGRGVLETIDAGLVVNHAGGGVFDNDLLKPPAAEILKGQRRSVMAPFFRRLTGEGLWTDRTWREMSAAERNVVLHGFWVRPGLGTFVKSGSDIDGSEVGHWLKWDGLVSEVLGQLARSKVTAWRGEVERSRTTLTCSECSGSGHARHARLLMLGQHSVHDWALKGTVGELLDALLRLKGLTPRGARLRARTVGCLEPLRSPTTSMRSAAAPGSSRDVLRLASEALVGLDAVFE